MYEQETRAATSGSGRGLIGVRSIANQELNVATSLCVGDVFWVLVHHDISLSSTLTTPT